MKKHRGLILFALTVTAVCMMWDSLSVALFPRLVLSRAVEKRMEQLWEQYARSPMYALAALFEQDDNYSAELSLRQTLQAAEVCYDLNLSMMDRPRMLGLEGFLTLSGSGVDISVYLDPEEAAFSSGKLLKGGWYGFSFGTIGQEIADHPVLSFILGEETLQKLEANMEWIKHRISGDFPRIPVICREDIQDLGMSVLMLDLDTHRDVLEVNGRKKRACRLSAELSGDTIGADSPVALDFLMSGGSLYGVSACLRTEQGEYSAEVLLNDDGDTRFAASVQQKDEYLSVFLEPYPESSAYDRRILVSWKNAANQMREISACFRWDADTGNLWFRLQQDSIAAFGHAHLTRDRLRFTTNDLSQLLEILTGEGYGMEQCSLTLIPGAVVMRPDYVPFQEWSMDDLVILMEGLGGVLGLVPQ